MTYHYQYMKYHYMTPPCLLCTCLARRDLLCTSYICQLCTCTTHTIHIPGATWSKNPMAEESKMADDLPARLSASQLPGYGVAVFLLVLVAASIALAFVAGRRASGGTRGLLSGGRGSRSEEPPDDGL